MEQKKLKKREKKLLINARNFYDGKKLIIDAFKNEKFLKVPTGFEYDVDEEEVIKRHLDRTDRLPSKKSELPTIQEDFTVDDLDKCILVMLMILINCFLI